MSADTQDTDYLAMTDEEILRMNTPQPEEKAESEEVVEEQEAEANTEVEDVVEDEPLKESEVEDEQDQTELVVDQSDTVSTADTEKTAEVPVTNQTEEPDYKSFYERFLKNPIKANGKEIQLKSIEEVDSAVKMGLNYTKKMQQIAPAMRIISMLENNNLLDESKLSFLIDLDKGNPQAIQKLINDKKLDPLSFDLDKADEYVAGNHQVSDAAVNFKLALEDVATSESGLELITEVTNQWDDDSKQALYQQPGLLSTLAEQKAIGLYSQVTGEVERLKALGQIPVHVPFLQAYFAVGDMLKDQGRLVSSTPTTPVTERVVAPRPKVVNSDKAKAAATTKTTQKATNTSVNFLAQSDAEFLKQFEGRQL